MKPRTETLPASDPAYNTNVSELNRRHFLLLAAATPAFAAAEPWQQVAAILQRIHPPKIPERAFDIARFGARSDGKTDNTDAFRRASAECSQAGGGRGV